MLISLLLAHLMPGTENAFYDTLITRYRTLPLYFSWSKQYSGLHRSITLIGEDGTLGPQGDAAFLETLHRLREGQASASSWIVPSAVPLPDSLQNKPHETSPVYVTPARIAGQTTAQEVSADGQPPFVLKVDPDDGAVRDVYLALKRHGKLEPCLPLLLYARFLDVDTDGLEADGSWLRLSDRRLPVSEDEKGYTIPLVPHLSQIRAQLAALNVDTDQMFVADTMEPLHLQDVQNPQHPIFHRFAYRRFFFLGDYQLNAVGERTTSTGPFRDFQLAALSLDTLIQGPHVRRVEGWKFAPYYLLTSGLLALWLLSPASLWGRLARFIETLVAIQVLSLMALSQGLYFPLTWLHVYTLLLTGWMIARVWLTTMIYLRRYGGSAAARILLGGRRDLDHSEAEERVATIVFVGLPDHLRELETREDPHMLQHRQIFSAHVGTLTARAEGIVHDYQADYLMLGFGTQPGNPDPQHALRAFHVARQLVALKQRLAQDWGLDSPEKARVQVSVNSGLVAVGWVGTREHKRASAAIGDTTNVAARLLGTAKKLDLDLVISSSAYEFLDGSARFVPLPPVKLKGKTEEVAIFRLAEE